MVAQVFGGRDGDYDYPLAVEKRDPAQMLLVSCSTTIAWMWRTLQPPLEDLVVCCVW